MHGRARVSTDPALRARFAVDGKEPVTVLEISVDEVFAHCAKAFMRSGLWAGRARPEGLPTTGQLLKEHTANAGMDTVEYDRAAAVRLPQNLY